jgi:hypothetical protein
VEAVRVNRNKAAGTRWESAVVDYLRGYGWPYVERRALNGSADRGDIAGIPGVVIEAKNAKTISLAAWVDEARVERFNDGADVGAVWVKRRGQASAAKGYVVMEGWQFVQLLKEAGYR